MSKAELTPTTPIPPPHGITFVSTLDGFHRARVAIPVTLHRPTTTSQEIITGRLLGTMHDRGSVLHYRVTIGEGMCYLAPPHWLAADCRADVERAELSLASAASPAVLV